MSIPGGQWGYIERLRCSSRAVQVFEELPLAPGGLYGDSAYSYVDLGYLSAYYIIYLTVAQYTTGF